MQIRVVRAVRGHRAQSTHRPANVQSVHKAETNDRPSDFGELRTGNSHWIYPAEVWHPDQDHSEHDFHGCNDQTW